MNLVKESPSIKRALVTNVVYRLLTNLMKSLDYLLRILSIGNVLILCMLFHNTYTVPPVTSLTPNQRINILRVRMDKWLF